MSQRRLDPPADQRRVHLHVAEEAGRDLRREDVLTSLARPLPRREHVRQPLVQVLDPGGRPRAPARLLVVGHEPRDVCGVATTDIDALRRRVEPLDGEVPHQAQHPEPGIATTALHTPHKALVDEARQVGEDVCTRLRCTHLLHRLQRHRRSEHAHVLEEPALALGQQVAEPATCS